MPSPKDLTSTEKIDLQEILLKSLLSRRGALLNKDVQDEEANVEGEDDDGW